MAAVADKEWFETFSGVALRFVQTIVGSLVSIAFFLVLANLFAYGFEHGLGMSHKRAAQIGPILFALPLTIAAVAGSVYFAMVKGWIKQDMPRHATLPCSALEPGEEPKLGWYVATLSGERVVARVFSNNWGPEVEVGSRTWALGAFPGVLIAQADLDRLHIHPPEADFIRAQIGSIKGMLEGRSEEDDPIGHRQFTDRLEELEGKLAAMEGRT